MTRCCSIACRSIFLAVAVATGAAGAPAPPPALTLEGAVERALAAHPEIAAAGQEIAGARAALRGAQALPSPEAVVAPVGRVEDSQLSVRQPLAVNGERSAASAAARARLSALEARRGALRRDLAYRVRTAFHDALVAQGERDTLTQTAALLQQIHDAARKSFDLGNAPESHVVRTRMELTRARLELRLTEGEVAARHAALNAALGRDAATPVSLQGELPRDGGKVDAAAARAAAPRQRPEMAAARAELEALAAGTRLSRAGLRPDVILQAERDSLRRGGGSVGVGVTLPFLDWGRRRAEVRQAEAGEGAGHARLKQQENVIALEVEEALVRLQAARDVARGYEGGVLADAERLAKMTRVGYEEGALNYLEVLDAQRALVDARRGAIRARGAYSGALAALDRATGAPVVSEEKR